MSLQFPLNLTPTGNQALSDLADSLPGEPGYDEIINTLLILAASDQHIYNRLSLKRQKQLLIRKRTQQLKENH
ncbi:MAG: hypothetical protein MUC48_05090 [Leptolyngbya sp. Prado105]|jgi:hypothetical protein|nr:hypothetical protein [Leptolyngbya sp. Prado105]